MDPQKFMLEINKVQDLIEQEKYKEAVVLIEKLKQIESETDLDYNITHRLYQLDSNSRSLYNQQIIFEKINDLAKTQDFISFKELNQLLKEKCDLELSDDVLRREIELLILRNLLNCKIENEKIVF
jgi:hypothetical protein